MAQTGYTPISLYYSTTASAAPTAGNLVAGELAINTNDGKLFYKDSSGVVQTLASKGTGTIGGSNTQVQYNSSGSFAGSANMTFDGTSLSLTNQLNLTNASSYNLYASGAGANYMAGSLGVGGTPLAYQKLAILGTYNNGSGSQEAVSARGEFAGTVATNATFVSKPTVASGAALTNLWHFYTHPSAYTGTVTTQAGHYVTNALTGATNNYGFYSNLPAATGSYNLNMAGTADNYLAGALGIGSTSLTAINFRIGKTITGGTTAYGYLNSGTTQPDVTANAIYNHTSISTAANGGTPYTITALYHYQASQGTINADSTVSTQYGFAVASSLTGATNNYAFYGGIGSGTNRYNLYMAGTANNYLAGSLGIGALPQTATAVYLAPTISGATAGYLIRGLSTIASSVTSNFTSFQSAPYTDGTAYTLTALAHYVATQGTFGSTTVTNQFGFRVENSLTGATNNYSFYGNIASATGAWNLYMAGTADNYLAGKLGIGTTNLTGFNFIVNKNITGSTNFYNAASYGTVQSDVTGTAAGFATTLATQATSFTINSLSHFSANQSTIGAGSTVTYQYGFLANNSLTGATNNYGFYGNIASGSNRFNLYMNGTADNYLAGRLGVGIGASTNTYLRLGGNITGLSSSNAFYATGQIQTDVTSTAQYVAANSSQIAGATTTTISLFSASQGTISGTVTYQIGYFADSSLTGATNNYGFYGSIAAATGRYNLYMNGTADNYLAGKLTVSGATAIPAGGTAGVGVNLSSTANFGVFFGSGAPTLSAAKGSLYLRSDGSATNNRMYVNTDGSTTWTAVTTAA